MNGRARLGMVVTLSSSPQNGWETWFSCTYGEDLSKLRAPVTPRPARNLAKAVFAAAATAAKSAAELEKTPRSGPASKYLPRRTAQARHDARELELWGQLQAMAPKEQREA